MKHFFILILFFFFLPSFFASAEPVIELKNSDETLRIDFCYPTMFRVRRSPNRDFRDNETWMVRRYDFSPVEVVTSDGGDTIRYVTGDLQIAVCRTTLAIRVGNSEGKTLYRELAAPRFAGDSVQTTVVLEADEHFFGFGERMDQLDQRGRCVYLNVELGRGPKPAVGGKDVLRANYCPVPLMLSTRGYGIFFHTAAPNTWDMGWTSNDVYSFGATGGELDYYFIYGPEMGAVVDRYTDLTGKSPMLPRYAMGLHVGTYAGGTWKYESETSDRYPVGLARRLRAEGIPFDLMWLDSTWRFFNSTFGNGGCTFEWRETFVDPERMFRDLYAENVKAVGLHIRSILDNGPDAKLLDRAKAKGNVLMPDTRFEGLVNFFDTAAVNWWWENGARRVASIGASFFKTDVGGAYMAMPGGAGRYRLQPAELHNLYPLAYAEAPYRKFPEGTDLRGLTHTREGYAGIQRYPYIWAGDWGSEWQWFEPLIAAGMSVGLSGVGNWTHCMGGFEQYSAYDTELYVRWCQFGMFSPVAMVFGMDHPRYHEPWTYGAAALDNFRKYARLRYALLPYIYTAERELYDSARPMMAPLVMDFPSDENTYRLSRQYLFGPSMMVCPVTTKGALSQTVYFPGGEWFDYETGERIVGRQYKSFLTPLEVLPIYVRAGAIIPMQEPVEWVDQRPTEVLTLDVYPSGVSSYELYEDDGATMDYSRGVFSRTRFTSELTSGGWTFTAARPEGKYRPATHRYVIKAVWEQKPASVTENGKTLTEGTGWSYDEAGRRLWIRPVGDSGKEMVIAVR
jgi:alpha-glucosidase (family GH31 glycosyl hydrolase)